ncbi:hypothetical protein CTL2C_577 [Chlamydia trachomatis L2c]|nr:hypothetical protein CTL2C_577 [Chlamydia trachomatis L2c]
MKLQHLLSSGNSRERLYRLNRKCQTTCQKTEGKVSFDILS